MRKHITPGANETHEVEHTVRPSTILEKDLLLDPRGRVAGTKIGTKWVHVTFTSGKVEKLDVEAEVVVLRSELTDEAKKIRNREYAEKSLIKLLDKHRDHETAVAKSIEEAVAQVTAESRYGLGRQLDYLAGVAVQRARADLWSKVLWMFYDAESPTHGDVIATFLKARKIFTRDLVEDGRYSRGPLSRSTSMMSNLADDLERHERVKFIDDTKWELAGIDGA